ncbi:MAG: adenylyltransferase/cytidyltransferase family protein, partial [Deltaproteobacteria bacterium]|nr:adenylyltransferase/cytidyltransferase family protein [Deltaproteobacteria bacterium]
MSRVKIIPFDRAKQLFSELRSQGKKIVQCHGTFDLIHPGHIYHLEEAKELGDVLVVTVTAEKYVNKGPGRPYFNDFLRCKSLAALACVDYVVLVPFPAAKEAIECVQPHIYCKGREYEDPENDPSGKIQEDVATVEALGGQVRFIGSVVFSSSKLINQHFDAVPEGVKLFCQKLARSCSPKDFRKEVESFADLKVLVLGDVIFDRYTYVTVQGLTSKNRILSTRMLDEETHSGGALAVYRHVRQFTSHVDFCSIVGSDRWTHEMIEGIVPKENDLTLYEEGFTTIIKQRFIEDSGAGKELLKLFAVNVIDSEHPGREVADKLLKILEKNIKKYDLVIVADFGHGTMLEQVRRFVEAKAAFMSLNCQTNSNNYGFNVINRQYRRTDAFS